MLSSDKVAEADAVGTEVVNVVAEVADVVADLVLLDRLVVLNLLVVHWVLRSELRLLVLLHWEWMYGLYMLLRRFIELEKSFHSCVHKNKMTNSLKLSTLMFVGFLCFADWGTPWLRKYQANFKRHHIHYGN
jgi:hypothetical protein